MAPMEDNDIHGAAETMIRRYGDYAASLMDRRSSNCRRHGEIASAAFWHLVAQEVRAILWPIPRVST
jgi:hypothetical protein